MTSSSTRRSAPSARSSGRRSACWWWMPRWACTTRISASPPTRGRPGAGLIIVVNKWDLIEEKDANTAHRGQEELIAKAPFLQYVPFVYVSALTGQRVAEDARPHPRGRRCARAADPHRGGQQGAHVAARAERAAAEAGEEVKLLYASQIGTAPPTFAIVSNRPDGRAGVLPAVPDARLPLGSGRSPVRRSGSSSRPRGAA